MRGLRFLLLLPFLVSALPGGAVSVYLHRTARVGQEMVALGDIATVVGADGQGAEHLRRLPLWRGSGRPGLVPASLIKRRVAAAVGGQVVVVGAQTLVLPGGVADGVELEFYTALLEAVAALPAGISGRVEVELLSAPELPAAAPEGAFQVALEQRGASGRRTSPQAPLGGLFQVVYGAKTGDGAAGTQRGVGVRIRQFLPVAVAARDLPAGSLLSWEDLALDEQDVSALSGGYLSLEDRPESFRTTAPIPRGQRVDPARLERYYLVRAGDTVTVVFLRPGLRVSLPGRSLGSGAAGDRVEVRTREAARRFYGRISPSGEVIVEEL